MAGVFADEIPNGAPVLVVLIEQDGCPACSEYHPIFEKVAAPYAAQGLPIFRLDAASNDPVAQNFMTTHGVEHTPTVVVATLYRGALGKLEGVVTETETRRLLDIARAHNRPRTW